MWRPVGLIQALGGAVQVNVVRYHQVVADSAQVGKCGQAEAARTLAAVRSWRRNVLVLKVGIEGNMALESFLAGRAHEGERLAAAAAAVAAPLLLFYLERVDGELLLLLVRLPRLGLLSQLLQQA